MTYRGDKTKCSYCAGGVFRGEHYPGCPKAIGAKPKPSASGYGVFIYAHWHHERGVVEEPSGGYVTRNLDSLGVPYSRMTPVRVFKRKADADKFGDKLTFG